MKKFLALLALLPSLFIFSGCKNMDSLSLLKNSMSEVSEVYFSSGTGDLRVTITSGTREEPYLYDGKSCDKLDFALLSANLEGDESELVTLSINGEEKDYILEFNFLTKVHMADLEFKLSGSEQISFKYMDKVVDLTCVSAGFNVDSNAAIETGYTYLKNDIDAMCENGKFKGEAYLRVADYLDENETQPVWLFSVLDENKQMKNLIISTSAPEILADGKQVMI